MKDLSNQTSPKYKALSWIALEDELVSSPHDPSMIDRFIIAVLYYSTGGDLWKNNSGWLSPTSVCSWYGVVDCTENQRHVTDLNFITKYEFGIPSGNELEGMLPTELGSMQMLTSLRLGKCHFAFDCRGKMN